jgi:DHA1 family bicyclomycin/chloramphenicol resistance-like MFS transporter
MSVNTINYADSISRRYYLFLIVFLGMLTAFGPFVTDMYLPVLPNMVDSFNASAMEVQMGLTASMIGLALGQLLFGPLSDRYGRRQVLFASLAMFTISTTVSLYSLTIDFFNIMRFFQGVGAAGGVVLARSVATDAYSGRELAKTMAIIGAINGVAPVTAPIVGGAVAAVSGWRGIFVILLALGIMLILLCTRLRETLPVERRETSNLKTAYASFFKVLKIREYVVYLIAYGFANGVLFGYISSSPFVVQTHFGISEFAFAIFFGLNSVSIGIGTMFALKFKDMNNAALFGAIGMTIFSVLQYLGYLTFDSLYVYIPSVFMMLLSLGFVLTAATTKAMDAGRDYTGASSAVFGALGFLIGGLVSPIVGMGNLMHSMSITLIVSAVLALVAVCIARR